MDPIELFIKNKHKFSLTLLTTAHSRLSVLQLQKGCVTQEDTQQSLRSQIIGQQMTAADISAHAGLLFESIISPSLSATGQIKLTVNKDVVGNDENFINAILGVVTSKCGGVEYPWVEEFKQESLAYLSRLIEAAKPMTEEPVPERPDVLAPPEFSFDRTAAPAKVSHLLPSPVAGVPAFIPSPPVPQLSQLPPAPTPMQSHMNSVPPQAANNAPNAGVSVEYDGPEEHKYAPARVEFERAEPIVRLLAQVRKVGMDILFPQSTHDKILAIIFVAVRSFATPAHRELIDMVMTVKEANKVSQLEPVSKTKIRGVLALLKHGELLTTQGEYGEPVRLSLAPGIESFKDLRERHDSFLNLYMMDHHLFIPSVLRTELVWQLDDETRAMRLEAMDRLVLKLKLFFSSHAEYSMHAVDRDTGGNAAAGSATTTTGNTPSTGAAGNAGGADSSFKPPFGPGGYGGRGPNNKFNNMGGPMGMPMQVPGGRGAGRGYVPYGGRGAGRYGYSNYYNNTGFEGPYGPGGAGYGYAPNPPGGRFGHYTARLAQQRMANAHASASWANNEDYAELANDDWGEGDGSAAATAGGAAGGAPRNGSGGGNGAYNSNKNNVTQLSPQAPSFDPSQLKTPAGGPTPATAAANKTSAGHGHHGQNAHSAHPHGGGHGHGHGHSHHHLTPKSSLHNIGDMLSFDYSRLESSPALPGSLSTSRLASLNGLNLIDTKDASTGRIDPSLDDNAWLAAAAAGGRSNFDFWNDSTSNFFDSLGSTGQSGGNSSLIGGISGGSGINSSVIYSTNGGASHSNDLSFGLGELSLNSGFGSLAPAPGLFSGNGGGGNGGLTMNMHPSGSGFDSSLDPVFTTANGSMGAGVSNQSLDRLSPVPQSLSPLPNQNSNFSFADSSTSLSTSNSVLDD